MTSIWHHLTYTSLSLKCSLVMKVWLIPLLDPGFSNQPTSKKAAWCAFKAASLKEYVVQFALLAPDDCLTNQKYWEFCLLLISKPNKKTKGCLFALKQTVGVRERPPAICLSDGSCAGETRTKASRQSKKSIQVGQCLHPDPPEWERFYGIPTKIWKMTL